MGDGNSINYARRNDILKEKERFFGYKKMAEKYEQNVFKAFNLISNDKKLQNKYIKIHNNNDIKYELLHISIYGEMFGGFFPAQKPKNNRRRRRRRRGNRVANNNDKDKNQQNDNDNNTNQWVTKSKKNKNKQS